MEAVIIGVGLHPFGRFGPTSALEMGAHAIRSACADAGVRWTDVQLAVGGSRHLRRLSRDRPRAAAR